MEKKCVQKQIKNLCLTFSKETGAEFKNYFDTTFLEWLEKSNPTENGQKRKTYTFIETSKFAQAIMDAYMASMNDVSKKLDNHISNKTYTKQEVIEIVFDAFQSAKDIGENQIKKL